MEKVMWKGAERTGKRYLVTGNNIPNSRLGAVSGKRRPTPKKQWNTAVNLPSLLGVSELSGVRHYLLILIATSQGKRASRVAPGVNVLPRFRAGSLELRSWSQACPLPLPFRGSPGQGNERAVKAQRQSVSSAGAWECLGRTLCRRMGSSWAVQAVMRGHFRSQKWASVTVNYAG